MDMSILISRTVAEVLTVLFHGTIYLSLAQVYQIYFSPRIDLPFLAWTLIYGIIVGQSHLKLRLFFQTTSDKLFLHGKYDYYRTLAEASTKVGEKLSLGHILQILYATFHDSVEISNPRVFLPENFTDADKTSKRYIVFDRVTFQPDRDKDAEELPFDSPLINELVSQRQPLFGAEDINAALAIPCLLENRLIAIFALGPKLSEDPYTPEDLRLLEVLANQAAVAFDHTRSYEKIEADLEAASKQLERSQRLASIGTLTAGVTHEIRNPLTVIRAETERLTKQPRDKEYLKNYKELLLKHINRIEGIVQRMLGLAKGKSGYDTEIDLNKQLESILSLVKWDGVALIKELKPIPTVKGDPEELEQVFVNLIQNAMEAMPGGGEMKIKTYPEGGRSVIEISDNGNGIPSEIKERIFDPFFSTRHEGTGLGLSIVYRIVRQHGGDVKVDSEVGKGTTFKVIF